MRNKPSRFKSFIGAVFIALIGIYAIYVNPFEPSDTLYSKTFKNIEIQPTVPDRYEVILPNKYLTITVKGTRDMIKDLGDVKPTVTSHFEGEEGVQVQDIHVQGIDNYIYKVSSQQVEGTVEEIEPEEVEPKVIIKGTPTIKIKGVEVLDTINGYFKESEKALLDEVNVIVDSDKITDKNKKVEGAVEIKDVEGNRMSKGLVDKEKVEVEIITD